MKPMAKQIIKRMWRAYLIYLLIVAIVAVAIYLNTRSVMSALIIGLLLSMAYFKFIASKYQSVRAEIESETERTNEKQKK